MSIKLVASLLGVGSITVASVYLAGVVTEGIPTLKFLCEDSDYFTNGQPTTIDNKYKGKYGENYGKYLVGVVKPTDSTQDHNKAWWDWAFKNRYEPNTTKEEGFKTGITDGSTLRDACTKAYQGTRDNSNKWSKLTEGSSETKYKEIEIWKYCSPYETRIEILEDNANEANSVESSYGKKTEYRKLLVSTEENKNKWFWNLKQEELKNDTSLTEETNEFKKLKDRLTGIQTTPGANDKKTLRELCGEAYKKTENETGSYPKQSIFKFCSITGKTPS